MSKFQTQLALTLFNLLTFVGVWILQIHLAGYIIINYFGGESTLGQVMAMGGIAFAIARGAAFIVEWMVGGILGEPTK